MRRAKIGDVYAVPLRNGYKIIQWAYSVPRRGKAIRVFPGIYKEIPKNIPKIVSGKHSYIIDFHVSRAYRIGIITFLENLPIPEKYPCPTMEMMPWINGYGKLYTIVYRDITRGYPNETIVETRNVRNVPKEFRDCCYLSGECTPSWLFYYFEFGYDLDHLHLEFPGLIPGGTECTDYYQKIVDEALEKDSQRRAQAKALKHKKEEKD